MKPKGGFWWAVWAALFIAYEFWAIGYDVTYTLSWNTWQLMDDYWLARVVVIALVLWLLKHFTWDWWKTRHLRDNDS